jgi:hypothetical protein
MVEISPKLLTVILLVEVARCAMDDLPKYPHHVRMPEPYERLFTEIEALTIVSWLIIELAQVPLSVPIFEPHPLLSTEIEAFKRESCRNNRWLPYVSLVSMPEPGPKLFIGVIPSEIMRSSIDELAKSPSPIPMVRSSPMLCTLTSRKNGQSNIRP